MRCRRASRRQVPAASPVAKPDPSPPHPRGPGPDGIGPDQAMGREVLMIQQPWWPRLAVGHTAVGKIGCHSALLMPEDDFAVVCLRERFLLERRVSWRSPSPGGTAGSYERTVENPRDNLNRDGSPEREPLHCSPPNVWTVFVQRPIRAYFEASMITPAWGKTSSLPGCILTSTLENFRSSRLEYCRGNRTNWPRSKEVRKFEKRG